MKLRLIISILLTLFTANLYADITIHYDSIRHNQVKPSHSVQVKQDLVRLNQSGGQHSVMLNLDTGDLVQLHAKSKSFFKINASTLNQYVSIYRENKGLMQGLINQGLKQLDPQRQQQINKMLQKYEQNSNYATAISFKNTGHSMLILGVQCQIYAIYEQGKHTRDVCLSDYKQLGLPQQDVQSFEKLKLLVKQFKQSNSNQQDMISMLLNGLEDFKGIPLKMVNYYPDGRIKSVLQAGSISLRAVPKIAYLYHRISN